MPSNELLGCIGKTSRTIYSQYSQIRHIVPQREVRQLEVIVYANYLTQSVCLLIAEERAKARIKKIQERAKNFMDTESILIFAQGMVFYHGVISLPSEKLLRIASTLSLVLFFHKVNCNMNMYEFIQRLPSQKRNILSGVLLFVGILMSIESLVVYIVDRFIPYGIIYVLERAGGLFILASIILIFSALWIVGSTDATICSFIDQGIYAYIRHPYYLGLTCLFTGVCLAMGNMFTIVIAVIVLKDKVAEFITDEEEILSQKHKTYAKYRQRVISGMPTHINRKTESSDSILSQLSN